jgi:hypothetical protein
MEQEHPMNSPTSIPTSESIIRPRSATAVQKRPCQIMPKQNRTLLEGAVAEGALKIAPR